MRPVNQLKAVKMSNTPDIYLTPVDLTLLESLLRTGEIRSDEKRRAIREKLANARIVFLPELPPGRITTGARVRFQVDNMKPEERVLTSNTAAYPTGAALDVRTPRGIALLGQQEGDRVTVPDASGGETITVLSVLYRPDGQIYRFSQEASPERRPVGAPFSDDPGPSAA